MTDKQIIIDGVDVSGCEFFDSGNCVECDMRVHFYGDIPCDDECNRNCYYKQLKAKEQECEELKKIINEAKNSKLDLNSFFAIEATVGEYQLELDQLKADREEALKQLEFVRTLNTVKEAEIRKLSKTLTEIKEIVTLDKTSFKYAGSTISICDDILIKISEVTND